MYTWTPLLDELAHATELRLADDVHAAAQKVASLAVVGAAEPTGPGKCTMKHSIQHSSKLETALNAEAAVQYVQ